jgi:hypothetical protein
MQAHIRVGHEWMPSPRFAIGDAVVHLVDCPNIPGSEWHDELDDRDRFFYWYRGVVVGVELDYRTRYLGRPFVWVYRVRIVQAHDECAVGRCWDSKPAALLEYEIKPSRYTARLFTGQRQDCSCRSLALA